MTLYEFDSLPSTNAHCVAEWARLEKPSMVIAATQTAGRGQRGNSWESEPGSNLTVSVAFEPCGMAPCQQFIISAAVSLALVDLLKTLGVEAKVKWPNDIYAGDKKIAGILIENAILGNRITRTVAGIGLNLNQTEFLSDAPNPVSVRMLTGEISDIPASAERLGGMLACRMPFMEGVPLEEGADEALLEEYRKHLWRGDSALHPFYDRKSNERIQARIVDVKSDGELILATPDGNLRNYFFKEVEFLL